ncbi:MAG: hypothetical protein U1F43_09190 [Myxococcota bacterium]
MLDFLKAKGPAPTFDKPAQGDSARVKGIKAGLRHVPFEEQVARLTPRDAKAPVTPARSNGGKGQHSAAHGGHAVPLVNGKKPDVKSDDAKTPLTHPLFSLFRARVASVFSDVTPPSGFDVDTEAARIWGDVCARIAATEVDMSRTASPSTYSNPARGYVDMGSPGYAKAVAELDSVAAQLKAATRSQFMKAESYGFWSKGEGKELAKQHTDLTLETSGIGALFDDMPSINGHENGWDAQLWGSLSQAYAEALVESFGRKGKQIHVFAGGDADKTNVFAKVESKALEKGLHGLGRALEKTVTFHAAAALAKKERKPDLEVQHGSVPGTWYSGPDWNTSLTIGRARFDVLPEKRPAAPAPAPAAAPVAPAAAPGFAPAAPKAVGSGARRTEHLAQQRAPAVGAMARKVAAAP